VAVALFNMNGIIEQWETLINPECEIPESSIAIHHITPDMVKDQPTIKEVLPHILKMIGNYTIVGHGIKFDVDIVANAAEKNRIPCSIRNNKTIDTLRMARHYGESPVNSLEQLRKHFHIPLEGAHRALNDVIVNVDVFRNLAKDYKNLGHLFQVLSKPILLKIMPLGPHKGRPLKEVPFEYLQWAARKEFDEDLTFTIRSEIARRKKGNLFTQAGNPFSNL
jgi:DNA polymerase III subunit epsilon